MESRVGPPLGSGMRITLVKWSIRLPRVVASRRSERPIFHSAITLRRGAPSDHSRHDASVFVRSMGARHRFAGTSGRGASGSVRGQRPPLPCCRRSRTANRADVGRANSKFVLLMVGTARNDGEGLSDSRRDCARPLCWSLVLLLAHRTTAQGANETRRGRRVRACSVAGTRVAAECFLFQKSFRLQPRQRLPQRCL